MFAFRKRSGELGARLLFRLFRRGCRIARKACRPQTCHATHGGIVFFAIFAHRLRFVGVALLFNHSCFFPDCFVPVLIRAEKLVLLGNSLERFRSALDAIG
jgi:hypothetical protein